jgi:hypothetical protein
MNCVYRASSVEQADIVIAWLAEEGISAFVKDRNMAGNYVALAVAPRGVEVCVANSEEAVRAESLLQDHLKSIKPKTGGPGVDKVIPVLCSECGRQVEFPGELYGSVQNCPSCGRNIDVGDPPHYC